MTVPSGGQKKVRAVIASLALGLLPAPGCNEDAETTTTRPPNPVPRADQGVPVQPTQPGTSQGGAAKDISNVGKDLRKDLGGGPVIRPDAPATTAPPAATPGSPTPGTP